MMEGSSNGDNSLLEIISERSNVIRSSVKLSGSLTLQQVSQIGHLIETGKYMPNNVKYLKDEVKSFSLHRSHFRF